jgi:hypothetical protein
MSKNHTQLSFEQSHQIDALFHTGRSQKEIAQQNGVLTLRPSAGNFGAIRLEEAPQHVVVAPEMPNARRLNAMPTNPKPLNSTIA